jgi:2'-5' RNA ligase
VAWVAPDNFHLTLKFLGAVDESRVPAVADAMLTAVVGVPPFTLTLRGLGAFPSPRRARVIWAGAHEGTEIAAVLAGRVDAALGGLGFPREERPFASHITLGRVRTPARNPVLADALAAAAVRDLGAVPITRVSLMQSQLSPRGARYTELRHAGLG